MRVCNDWECPRCGGEQVKGDKQLLHYLFCLICGLAVHEDDAAAHAQEVAANGKA